MKIKLTSVFVADQAKALAFYTGILGFQLKSDMPAGKFRWLTVVSPDEPDGAELLLEPNDNPAAKSYQAAIKKQGIAAAAFAVDDVMSAHARLSARGVKFAGEPADAGGAKIALFDDTCGNFDSNLPTNITRCTTGAAQRDKRKNNPPCGAFHIFRHSRAGGNPCGL